MQTQSDRVVSLPRLGLLCLLAAFVGALPSCRRGRTGPPGPGATIQPQKVDAPSNLRLQNHPAGAPHYLLRWDANITTAVPAMHVVYASTAASGPLDPEEVVAAVGRGVDAAAITLFGDTGMRYLRITAVSATGDESAPSTALALDTTARLLLQLGDSPTDLYSYSPSTADPLTPINVRVADEQVTDYQASPDGRRVAYLSDRDTANSLGLWVAPIDGSSPPKNVSGTLVTGGSVSRFQWSPSGDRLAFTAIAEAAGVLEAFVVPADDASARIKVSGTMVAGGGLESSTPVVWSAKGDGVAYLARQRDNQLVELFVADSTGKTEPIAVSGNKLAGSQVFQFEWAPDGRQLWMIAQRTNPYRELFVVTPDGSTDPAVRSDGMTQLLDAQWSPDSTRLALLVDDPGLGQQLFVTTASATSTPVRLDVADRPGNLIASYAWSPDALRIAFVASYNNDGQGPNELFVSPATGGVVAAIVNGDMVGQVEDFKWSPDSEQLAFRANKTVTYATGLYTTVPGFGGEPFEVSGTPPWLDVESYDWSTSGDRLAFGANIFSQETRGVLIVDRFANQFPDRLTGTESYSNSENPVAFPHLGQR